MAKALFEPSLSAAVVTSPKSKARVPLLVNTGEVVIVPAKSKGRAPPLAAAAVMT
ncbi:MAG: hypothetical protein V9F04_16970 [Dermatophilaceae bacterium]